MSILSIIIKNVILETVKKKAGKKCIPTYCIKEQSTVILVVVVLF